MINNYSFSELVDEVLDYVLTECGISHASEVIVDNDGVTIHTAENTIVFSFLNESIEVYKK